MARPTGIGSILRKNLKQAVQPEAKEYEVLGRRLVCLICDHARFHLRHSTFDKYASRGHNEFACEQCGFVLSFLHK